MLAAVSALKVKYAHFRLLEPTKTPYHVKLRHNLTHSFQVTEIQTYITRSKVKEKRQTSPKSNHFKGLLLRIRTELGLH